MITLTGIPIFSKSIQTGIYSKTVSLVYTQCRVLLKAEKPGWTRVGFKLTQTILPLLLLKRQAEVKKWAARLLMSTHFSSEDTEIVWIKAAAEFERREQK